MKQWFNKLAGWQKTILHFIFFFIIYLVLYISFYLLWPVEKEMNWKEYLSQAFVFSFILEALFHWVILVPDYFKKSKTNETTS